MDKQYDPGVVEDRWYRYWEEREYFRADVDSGRETYTIVIPPPNVTGVLHMGHALNETIQDILIRSRRMRGYETLWVPGVDHAGIATQNVVEKQLRQEGRDRHEIGRQALVERIREWKDDRERTIIEQLKKMGCACDWSRYRFTMDERLSRAVRRVFVSLYDKGLIYRGKYIINWCPRCQTALADEEVDHNDTNGRLYHIRYPFADGDGSITVATTRPETMLGDTAVAVNPDDERYKEIIGRKLRLPVVGREIEIIADSHVDPEFGTGLVKVTPAHDPNDFEIGRRHNLEQVQVMAGDGTMNERAGQFAGLDRFEARKKLVERLDSEGLLEKTADHAHSVGHCYRCDTMVEPYLSTQWFVKMKPLAEPALEVVRAGKIKFHPARWTRIYYDWLENIRDWCISRQIWWGHQVPVWYCDSCDEMTVSETDPDKCAHCGGAGIRQDEDVLDTWFSSQLWPFTTLGWPEDTPDLRRFYPTNVLSTAPEIIFFWVARMIMAGLEFMGDIPFSDVYFHGTVRDDTGRKMSKSLGNAVDPLEVIEQFGADAMRFTLISITATGTDVYLSEEKFHLGRNFANKLWNASRFVMMNFGDGFEPTPLVKLSLDGDKFLPERWIVSRLQTVAAETTSALDAFRLNDAAGLVYRFIWHDYCDWYIELTKGRMEGKPGQTVRSVLWHVLESALRLLHPIMPFITEDIWQRLPHQGDSILEREWVAPEDSLIDTEAVGEMELLQEIITAVRTIRSEMNVPPGSKAGLFVVPADEETRRVIETHADYVHSLAKVDKLQFIAPEQKPGASGVAVIGGSELFVPLEGLIDLDKEREKLAREADKLRGLLTGIEKKLANGNFVSRAPAEVVEKEREKQETMRETLDKVEKNIEQLAG
ncbi:MAG: valine--tRNA ligase [Candidatus Glassbacteria bacterium]|nr:valine--tRNA ligase [Candidatus Glassbacteria bacterium]